MKVMSIVAWALAGILVIAAGALGFLWQQQAGQAAGLRDTLAQVATAAGAEEVSAATLENPATLPDVLQQVEAEVADLNMELATAKDGMTAAQNEAASAKAEAAALTQKVQEQTAQAEALAKDLAAKADEATAAKAEAEKTAQDLQAAQEAADQQKAELEGALANAKAQLAEETAKLQAELEAARQAAQAAAAAAATVPEEGPEAVVEPSAAEPPAEKAPKTAKPKKADKADKSDKPEAWEKGGQVIGESRMFSAIRYSFADQSLLLRLWDGQKLAYQNVPVRAYDALVGNVETLDMNYRFSIQGKYKSLPPDSVVVRKFWKDSRRKNYRGDVRVIGPVGAAEEAAAAPAEAEPAPPAEEAAPAEAEVAGD